MIIVLMLITLVILLILGVPAFFSMAFSTLIFFSLERGIMNIPFEMIAQKSVYGLNHFALLAVPLFLLVGRVMNESGTTERLFDFAKALVGHLRGGLAHVNVVASVIFAGMSGSAVADAAGLGQIEIRAMRKAKYDLDFSCAVTAASSLIGPIIPPSVPIILYAILAGVSVNSLLIAGIIPGIVLALSLMVYIAYVARKRNYPVDAKASLKRIGISFKKAFLPLLAPVGLVGGIVSGVFTATEAGAVVALYAILLSVVVYRTISLKKLYNIFKHVMYDSGIVMIILAIANVYSYILTKEKLPVTIANLILSISDSYLAVMFMMIVFLLFMGCFMSALVTITIATPVLVPIVIEAGGDPLHFGIVMLLALMVGELTPPFGMVLFAIMKVSGISFDRLVKAVFPFLIPVIAVIILAVIFPEMVTFLPNLIMRN
ncbi:TRAP transporter large permease [Alkalihalobacillus sp. AL-G]|uniref:TRAP transporter large permease n=1 Tax=Alkalihalobacillus sp. AL-G TaxID=2926399 RepID=UPI00272C48CE|nr:TRAP transporter large permease [Alkalihalobacillus sp. AL-G]WLD94540.1 TRAP transporter large permease [Alkalihalobacillus sp. AL-G]